MSHNANNKDCEKNKPVTSCKKHIGNIPWRPCTCPTENHCPRTTPHVHSECSFDHAEKQEYQPWKCGTCDKEVDEGDIIFGKHECEKQPVPEKPEERWRECQCWESQKAIKELYKITGMNFVTKDITAMATLMLENYEQERVSRYVRHLEEQVHELSSLLAEAEKKAHEEGYIEGQKHAFGVDKRRVENDAITTYKADLSEKVKSGWENIFRPTNYRCGQCGLNVPAYCRCPVPKVDIEQRVKSFLSDVLALINNTQEK